MPGVLFLLLSPHLGDGGLFGEAGKDNGRGGHGDTALAEGLVDAYRGCDGVVHEVYSFVGLVRQAPEWRRYHVGVHTSLRELAEIAAQAKPGLLILHHQLFHGVTEGELLREVKGAYGGEGGFR
jgi:ribonuclease BN (tRNA processing enzyme)